MRRGGDGQDEGLLGEIKIGAAESLAPSARLPAWMRRPRQEIGAPAPGVPSVAVSEAVFAEVHRVAAASDAEIGGLLLGEICRWAERTHVEVTAVLPAERTDSGPTHVTFTADSWSALLARKEREHPGRKIVGWYHSHPRMGIFLSAMDLAIHRGFFPQPWHIALVVDGQSWKAGFFAWEGEHIRPARHLIWLPDEPRLLAVELTAVDDSLRYHMLEAAPAGSRPVKSEREPQAVTYWWKLAAAFFVLFCAWQMGSRWLKRPGRRSRRRERGVRSSRRR